MIKDILFCAEFSGDSYWAFTYAFDLAKAYKANWRNSRFRASNLEFYLYAKFHLQETTFLL